LTHNDRSSFSASCPISRERLHFYALQFSSDSSAVRSENRSTTRGKTRHRKTLRASLLPDVHPKSTKYFSLQEWKIKIVLFTRENCKACCITSLRIERRDEPSPLTRSDNFEILRTILARSSFRGCFRKKDNFSEGYSSHWYSKIPNNQTGRFR